MNNFASRIKNIEARMNRLKTFGLSSSSSVKTTAKTITLPIKIVPYKINYEWDNCGGQYSYRVRVNWVGANGLCSIYMKSPINLRNRRYGVYRLTNTSFNYEFGVNLMSGSKDDLAIFNNGGSIPEYNIQLEIVATADFTISYTRRQEH